MRRADGTLRVGAGTSGQEKVGVCGDIRVDMREPQENGGVIGSSGGDNLFVAVEVRYFLYWV